MSGVPGGTPFHVTGSGVVASAGGGVLHMVVVNTGATGATLTLYDGTSASGKEIAAIAATATVALPYDANLSSGLYAAITGSIDVTVVICPPPAVAP